MSSLEVGFRRFENSILCLSSRNKKKEITDTDIEETNRKHNQLIHWLLDMPASQGMFEFALISKADRPSVGLSLHIGTKGRV